jgi:GT2 family glycosyltransferase
LDNEILPFISVIIAARDDETLIRNCLISLINTDYPKELREFLVVDNGSKDQTPQIIKSFPVKYLYEERKGISYARNNGIEAGKGDIFLFTDPDCVVSTGWIREIVRVFENEDAGVVAGAIIPYPGETPAVRYAARRRSHSQERPMSLAIRSFAMTPNIAFRREVFDKIGLFDSRFPGGGWEDADLCWRFSNGTNLKLKYAPRAVVFHRYRTTAKDFFNQHRRYGHGLAILCAKYRDELPWGWRDYIRTYLDLVISALTLIKIGLLRIIRRCSTEDFYQLGQRLGSIQGSLFRN